MKKTIVFCFILLTINVFSQQEVSTSKWEKKIKEKESEATSKTTIWDQQLKEKENEVSKISKLEIYWTKRLTETTIKIPLTAKQKATRISIIAVSLWFGYFYGIHKYQEYDIKQTRKANGW